MSNTTPHTKDTEIITETEFNYPEATFTIAISNQPNLTKQYDLVDGDVAKTRAGTLSSGTVTTETAPLDRMIDVICNKSTPSYALIHGVCGYESAQITTKGNESEGVISRSKEHFHYGANALFMLDHDPSERGQNFTFVDAESYLSVIDDACPAFRLTGFVVKPSTSSGITAGGAPVSKEGGFHAYCVAKDGSDIPRAAEVLFKLLVMAGYGYVFISKSGSTQVRTIFDKQVFQPERLDYIAPAIVGEGLTIDQPAPRKFEGGYLDTSQIADLTDEQEAEYWRICNSLLDDATEEAAAVRESYLGKRSTATGIPVESLREQYERGEQGIIDYEMPLTRNDGTQFIFEEAIADPKTYHCLSMRDPYEPEYGEDKAKLYLNNNGTVNVHSYCHGVRTYQMHRNGAPYFTPSSQSALSSPKMSFNLISAGDIVDQQPPPMEWLIDEYMLRGAQCHLIGESSIGKSFFAIALALSIAAGRNFMGRRVKQGAAVYINAEGHVGMKWRVKGWEQQFGSISGAPFYLSEEQVDFRNQDSIKILMDELNRIAKYHDGHIEAIFVDTLHRNMQGDENSSQDFGLFMGNLERLCRRYGAAGIVLHHPGHNTKDRGRGTSSQRASLDTELLLKKVDSHIELKHIKLKDGGGRQPPIGYRLKPITIPWVDADGDPLTTCVPEFYPVGDQNKVGNAKKLKPIPQNPELGIQTLITAMNGGSTATREQWKDVFATSYGGAASGLNKAFSRAVSDLVKNGVLLDGGSGYSFTDCSDCPWIDIHDHVPDVTAQPLNCDSDIGVTL